MGDLQTGFLERFKKRFEDDVGQPVQWAGGQIPSNCGNLPPILSLRRGGIVQPREEFELGDLRCDFSGVTVIVEYESSAISTHNLLKYWPYTRGELSSVPRLPILLCHFSDWASYGSLRDLWQWLCERIREDSKRVVGFDANQFDHGGKDRTVERTSIRTAVDWVLGHVNLEK